MSESEIAAYRAAIQAQNTAGESDNQYTAYMRAKAATGGKEPTAAQVAAAYFDLTGRRLFTGQLRKDAPFIDGKER